MAPMKGGRRQYLRTLGGALAIGCSTGVASSTTTQSEVMVTGRVEAYGGSPVAGRKLYFTKSTDSTYIETDAEGEFETTVMSDSNVTVALYKSGDGQLHAPVQNGVPHIYVLHKFYTRSSDEDLGTLTAPQAYKVDLRALREDGSPAPNADFGFGASYKGSTFGSGNHWLTATENGYLQIRNADFTGIELSDSASVTIEVPAESGATHKFEKSINVDQPMTITAQIGEGIATESGETDTKSSATTTETTTTQESTTTESTTSTTAASTTTTSTATSARGETAGTTSPTTANDTRPERGFFSNKNPEGEAEFLRNPFVLTVGGFALSILGVLQNMVR